MPEDDEESGGGGSIKYKWLVATPPWDASSRLSAGLRHDNKWLILNQPLQIKEVGYASLHYITENALA
jgi:hypothetical protein